MAKPRSGPHKVTTAFSVCEIIVGNIFSTLQGESGCARVDMQESCYVLWGVVSDGGGIV